MTVRNSPPIKREEDGRNVIHVTEEQHVANTVFVERARALLNDFDLADAKQLKQARELLQREGIPQWTIFAVGDAPESTEADRRWASSRLQEMRDAGELP